MFDNSTHTEWAGKIQKLNEWMKYEILPFIAIRKEEISECEWVTD